MNRIIDSLDKLGDRLEKGGEEQDKALEKAYIQNRWFTIENSSAALQSVAENFLNKSKLQTWLAKYNIDLFRPPKRIGLILAGNLPLVGFHDILSVLVTGHKAKAKLSRKDSILVPYILNELKEIDAELADRVEFADRLKSIDGIIATGSDNTNRYFDYYFGKYPHIFRKNRGSAAIITGEETKEELRALEEDIFQYFGLGCRNVSKIYFPESYDVPGFMDLLVRFEYYKDHHKYKNNFDYNLTLLLMNNEPHFANEFIVLREDNAVISPVATIHYEYYENTEDLNNKLLEKADEIQCVVSSASNQITGLPFGKAQHPELWDYADNVDTVGFLAEI